MKEGVSHPLDENKTLAIPKVVARILVEVSGEYLVLYRCVPVAVVLGNEQ